MENSQRIGITETSDPAFHPEIFDNLCEANIIITKHITDKIIDKLIENKERCILHASVTGMGGTKIEPLVPTIEQSVNKMKKLIDKGFPVKQIVLRIDPIVPTEKGVNTAMKVIDAFKNFGIERVRISFLDMYNHVKERFNCAGITLPYDSFHADLTTRVAAHQKLMQYALSNNYKCVETCGEPGFTETPCISQKDVDILNLTDKIQLVGKKEQRTSCSCPVNKKELISYAKRKEIKCGHSCLYCYMKKDNE